MANDNIRVLGGLDLVSTLSYEKNYTDFPTDPKPRTLIVKEGMAYLYTELVTGSGYFTWTPIGLKQTAYLHTQGVASTTWTVTHNFGTQNFIYFVYDNNHVIQSSSVTILDKNTVQVNLSEAITGTAVFFSIQHVIAPNVTAVDSLTVNTITLRDSSGILTVNNNVVAMEESVAARIALVYTKTQSDSALTSAVSAEAVLRAAADTALGVRIDNVLTNTDATALNSLSELVTAFQAADSSLTTSISSLTTSAASALATEITNRENAVTAAISTAASDATIKVAAEATARDSVISTAIATEVTNRNTAITAGVVTSASKLTTARTINGASFDGSANISFNTSNVAEGTNLYYTDTRAKAAITAGTGITVTSGVVATTITQYTDALAKAAISVSGSLAYNSTTGVIGFTDAVTSVAGRTGAVTLTTDDISGTIDGGSY